MLKRRTNGEQVKVLSLWVGKKNGVNLELRDKNTFINIFNDLDICLNWHSSTLALSTKLSNHNRYKSIYRLSIVTWQRGTSFWGKI